MRGHRFICSFPALLLLLLAGCDYGSSSGDGVDEDDGIVVAQSLEDITMSFRDEPKMNLSSYFVSGSGLPVLFSAFSLGEVIAVDLTGSILSISPIQAGAETVTVVASRPGVDPIETSFEVEVLCPIEAGPEEADFFPIESGREWQYDRHVVSFSEDNQVDPEFEQIYIGTLSLTVSRFDSSCSSAEFTIQYRFEGTVEKRHPETGERKDLEPYLATYENEGSLNGLVLTWPAYFGEEIARIRPAESEDRVAMTLDGLPGTTGEAIFEKGVGMVEYHRVSTGTRSRAEVEMTLIR